MSPLTTRILVSVLAVALAAGTAVAGDVFLGITMDTLSPSMAVALQLEKGQGVLVEEVVEGSPAEEAGLQTGDVILRIADYEISGPKGLSKAIHKFDPGDEVTVTVMRAGHSQELDVTLGERKKSKHRITIHSSDEDCDDATIWSWFDADEDDDGRKVLRFRGGDGDKEIIFGGFDWTNDDRGFLGIVPGDRDRDELEDLGVPKGRGVIIEALVDDGPAEDAGLEEGDVIVSIDGKAIGDGDDLHDVLGDTESGEDVAVVVVRDGREKEFEIELAESPRNAAFGKHLRGFMPGDPHGPRRPRLPEFFSGGVVPHVDLEERERAREDLDELKDELQELREELRKLREELRENR